MSQFSQYQGEPIGNFGKPLSQSLITPSSMNGYHQFFRKSSTTESGYLELKLGNSGSFEKKWVVFDSFVLKFAIQPLSREEEFTVIPMERVLSFRTETAKASSPIILVSTTEQVIYLKFTDLEQMRIWLFNFQKSVAIVLTRIIEIKSSLGKVEDPHLWLRELGYRQGRYINLAKRHPQALITNMRSFTLEDMSDSVKEMTIDRDNFLTFHKFQTETDPAKIEEANLVLENNKNKLLAVSPAIPILANSFLTEDSDYRDTRIASSYRDEESDYNPLEEIIRSRLKSDVSDDDDCEDFAEVESVRSRNDSAEIDADLMFEMDDLSEPSHSMKNNKNKASNPRNQKQGTNNSSPRSSFSSLNTLNKTDLIKRLLKWKSGSCSKLGPRDRNEDRSIMIPNWQDNIFLSKPFFVEHSEADENKISKSMNTESYVSKASHNSRNQIGGGIDNAYAFFAVYDGHCGDLASMFLQEHLHEQISKHPSFDKDLQLAIKETCIQIDSEFLDILKRHNKFCGTTAVGAIVVGSELTVFNIGDSQAILCSNGQPIEMTDSHKPNRPDEAERIKLANGWITEEKELYMARLHCMDLNDPVARDKASAITWSTIHRVCGELAVSRSIGDPDYKSFVPGAPVEAFFSWPDGHNQIFYADLVIPDPECKKHTLTPADEFLILATDGLWDVVSPAEAIKLIKDSFYSGKTPSQASEELADLAIRLGSSDNVTIVIVQFIH